jgi:UDP-N-acetylmuramoyl-tripeptide--D-alanyl-D-alanine ligase
VRVDHGTIGAGEAAAAMGGRLVAGAAGRRLGGASIDSRTLGAGDVFFAVVAARDGHDYVAAAVARGASAVVVSRPVALPAEADVAVIEVADTVRALQDLGRAVRRASGARVVAITGSAGKTSTKEAIAAVLAGRHQVVRNRGNLNNHLGLPISLVELRHGADVAVMELGMNHPGEIRLLVAIAEPDVRVWTNVGEAHLGNFASSDGIADAKAEILEGAHGASLLVCNGDDPRVMARVGAFAGRTVTFGFGEGLAVRAADVRDLGVEGMAATLVTPAGRAPLTLRLVGRGQLANALAAAAVGLEFGVPLTDIVERLAALGPAEHRGAVSRTPSGVTVVDDSYNSSPSALKRALEVLAHTTPQGRRVAVLGEMLELGAHAEALHAECGRAAAEAGVARLIAVGGPSAARLAAAAREAGLAATAVTHVGTSGEAAALAAAELRAGDVVLVKGSRGIRTDLVVTRLLQGGA